MKCSVHVSPLAWYHDSQSRNSYRCECHKAIFGHGISEYPGALNMLLKFLEVQPEVYGINTA